MPSSAKLVRSTKPIALVTGASSGIGKAFAELLAKKGYDLVLVARNEDKLQQLAKQLYQNGKTNSEVLVADLSDSAAPQQIADILSEKSINVDFLVNNAGYSENDEFCSTEWKSHIDSIQVMLVAVTHLCHLLAPAMKQRRHGRIINISSIAAYTPAMSGSLYSGIKAYVKDLSFALNEELNTYGVHCTAVCPGLTRSGFHQRMGVQQTVDAMPKALWMTSEQVAKQGYDAVMSGKPLMINGLPNQLIAGVAGLIPDRWLAKIMPDLNE